MIVGTQIEERVAKEPIEDYILLQNIAAARGCYSLITIFAVDSM